MSQETRKQILLQVAEGALSPEEAAERLDELERPPPEPPTPSDGIVARVRVIGAFRTTRIVGDPDVREAVADGPHLARRDGDALIIEDDAAGAQPESFQYGSRGKRHVVLGLGSRPKPLEIRMNPALALEVELAAGTVNVRDVRGPIVARVDAGTARIEGFRSTIDVDVAAGSLHAAGVLAEGSSRVRCEAGSVRIRLEPGSDVRIRTKIGIGKVTLPDSTVEGSGGFRVGAGSHESVVGEGRATLDVEASLGSVQITAER